MGFPCKLLPHECFRFFPSTAINDVIMNHGSRVQCQCLVLRVLINQTEKSRHIFTFNVWRALLEGFRSARYFQLNACRSIVSQLSTCRLAQLKLIGGNFEFQFLISFVYSLFFVPVYNPRLGSDVTDDCVTYLLFRLEYLFLNPTFSLSLAGCSMLSLVTILFILIELILLLGWVAAALSSDWPFTATTTNRNDNKQKSPHLHRELINMVRSWTVDFFLQFFFSCNSLLGHSSLVVFRLLIIHHRKHLIVTLTHDCRKFSPRYLSTLTAKCRMRNGDLLHRRFFRYHFADMRHETRMRFAFILRGLNQLISFLHSTRRETFSTLNATTQICKLSARSLSTVSLSIHDFFQSSERVSQLEKMFSPYVRKKNTFSVLGLEIKNFRLRIVGRYLRNCKRNSLRRNVRTLKPSKES